MQRFRDKINFEKTIKHYIYISIFKVDLSYFKNNHSNFKDSKGLIFKKMLCKKNAARGI